MKAAVLMAIELFGPATGSYTGIACVVSYLFSDHTGIYRSQRVGHTKHHRHVPEGLKLGELSAYRQQLRKESDTDQPAD